METEGAEQSSRLRCSYRSVAVALIEQGLVCGKGTILIPMIETGNAGPKLSIRENGARLLSLLSVVAGQPVDPSVVLPPIEAAAEHWRCGDKALANLRLVFANLPRAERETTRRHLRLAADLLDGGMRPTDLMKALWPWSTSLEKYNRDQARKPTGVDGAGEWTFADDTSPTPTHDKPIVVATQRKPGSVNDPVYDQHRMFGQETFEEDVEHGRPIDPTSQVPMGAAGSQEAEEIVTGGLKAAVEAVGPGRGPVYGTRVHIELKARMGDLGREDINAEQSFKDGRGVKYGTPGSVRTDVGVGPKGDPQIVFDAKTGGARLTRQQIEAYKKHLPSDGAVEIKEVR